MAEIVMKCHLEIDGQICRTMWRREPRPARIFLAGEIIPLGVKSLLCRRLHIFIFMHLVLLSIPYNSSKCN
jgi:hypothetical protein